MQKFVACFVFVYVADGVIIARTQQSSEQKKEITTFKYEINFDPRPDNADKVTVQNCYEKLTAATNAGQNGYVKPRNLAAPNPSWLELLTSDLETYESPINDVWYAQFQEWGKHNIGENYDYGKNNPVWRSCIFFAIAQLLDFQKRVPGTPFTSLAWHKNIGKPMALISYYQLLIDADKAHVYPQKIDIDEYIQTRSPTSLFALAWVLCNQDANADGCDIWRASFVGEAEPQSVENKMGGATITCQLYQEDANTKKKYEAGTDIYTCADLTDGNNNGQPPVTDWDKQLVRGQKGNEKCATIKINGQFENSLREAFLANAWRPVVPETGDFMVGNKKVDMKSCADFHFPGAEDERARIEQQTQSYKTLTTDKTTTIAASLGLPAKEPKETGEWTKWIKKLPKEVTSAGRQEQIARFHVDKMTQKKDYYIINCYSRAAILMGPNENTIAGLTA